MWKEGMRSLKLAMHLGGTPQELLRSQVSMRMERIVPKGEAYRLIYLRQGWEAFFYLVKSF